MSGRGVSGRSTSGVDTSGVDTGSVDPGDVDTGSVDTSGMDTGRMDTTSRGDVSSGAPREHAAPSATAELGADGFDDALALVNEARGPYDQNSVPSDADTTAPPRTPHAPQGTPVTQGTQEDHSESHTEPPTDTSPTTHTPHAHHTPHAPHQPHAAPHQPHAAPHPEATTWPAARAAAVRAARFVVERTAEVRPALAVAPADALGLVLAEPIRALTDLPSFDTSAMDGWAVAGPGPWKVRQDRVLAGQAGPEPLADGEAVSIATGARVPREATAVIRSEHGHVDGHDRLYAQRDVGHGQDIRPRGQECRTGDQLLSAGTTVTPAVLGLAAASGYDALRVLPRPSVDVLVLGDELLTEGLPHDGLIRDALGPMLPHWLRALGADVRGVTRLGDDADAVHRAVAESEADLILTTGGTASGPVDHVHPTLLRIGAELLVDGVAVRPGHPMLLARTAPGQHLVGLPGNPLAAVSGLLTLAEPLLRTLAGHLAPDAYGSTLEPYELGAAGPHTVSTRAVPTAPLKEAVHGHPHDTRLVPVALRATDPSAVASSAVASSGGASSGGAGSGAPSAVPLRFNGPAMLRGIAVADGLAVVPPGGARAGERVEILGLPWSTGGFT